MTYIFESEFRMKTKFSLIHRIWHQNTIFQTLANLYYQLLKQFLITLQKVIYINSLFLIISILICAGFFSAHFLFSFTIFYHSQVHIRRTPFVRWVVCFHLLMMSSWLSENSFIGLIIKWDKSICILCYEHLQHQHDVVHLGQSSWSMSRLSEKISLNSAKNIELVTCIIYIYDNITTYGRAQNQLSFAYCSARAVVKAKS